MKGQIDLLSHSCHSQSFWVCRCSIQKRCTHPYTSGRRRPPTSHSYHLRELFHSGSIASCCLGRLRTSKDSQIHDRTHFFYKTVLDHQGQMDTSDDSRSRLSHNHLHTWSSREGRSCPCWMRRSRVGYPLLGRRNSSNRS